MIEKIHIQQLQVAAHVGVTAEERAVAQRLVINLTFWPIQTQLHADEIRQTIDYAAVGRCAKEFIEKSRYKLIETVAEEVGGLLLTRFPLRKVEIEVRKFVLTDTSYVSVTAICESTSGQNETRSI